MKYRVFYGRVDIQDRVYTEFDAQSDDEAKARFDKMAKCEDLQWDALSLRRVDVEEVTTPITSTRL